MPESRKILIIAESVNVEDSSGSKANVALISNLKEEGFEITLYHYTRRDIFLPGIKCIAIIENRFSFLFLLSRLQRKFQHFFRINIAKYLEPVFGFSFTFFNDVNSITKALGQEKPENYELIITLSKGASFRPHYAVLKLPAFHSKWMAYIHDPYPFYFYPEPFNWKEPGYRQKISFFKEVFANCQWAAFPSLMLKEWMRKYFTSLIGKGLIIPHQITTSGFGGSHLPLFFDLNKFTLLHAGNLLDQRPPKYLLEAFKLFLERNSEAVNNCQLLFLGNNTPHQQVLTEFAKEIDQIYISKEQIEYEVVQTIQKYASVNIIIEAKSEVSPFLPGKFPHCIAAGNPILLLGPKKSECRRLLGEDYPFWSEVDDVGEILNNIEQLYSLWKIKGRESKLERNDLKFYLSKENLKYVINKVIPVESN